MSPEERSAEMARRMKVRQKNAKAANLAKPTVHLARPNGALNP